MPADSTSPQSKKLIFLCTGNFYRSRIAEALFNHSTSGLGWHAISRGFAPASNSELLFITARKQLALHGISSAPELERAPLPIQVDELTEADLVVLLNESEHLPMLKSRYPWVHSHLEKNHRLRSWHVHDLGPSGLLSRLAFGWISGRKTQPFDSAYEHIHLAVTQLIAELQHPSK